MKTVFGRVVSGFGLLRAGRGVSGSAAGGAGSGGGVLLRGRRLLAVSVTVGLVASLLVGAAFERAPERAFSERVTPEQLQAEVLEGPAATSRASALEYLRGAGYSRGEARAIVDDVFGEDESLLARFFGTSDDASSAGDSQGVADNSQGASGVAWVAAPVAVAQPRVGLSRLPMADPTGPAADSNTPGSSSGTQITRFELQWVTSDDVDNGDAAVLYRKPDTDRLSDQVLQLVYGVQGERDYAPGEFVITIPAKNFTLRDVSTGEDSGKAGSLTIPYPEDPRKTRDFNWKLIGDNYVITNTRAMSAATKGYIEIAVSYDDKVHNLRDMAKHDIQARIDVTVGSGDDLSQEPSVLSQESNVLQIQVDSYQKILNVQKTSDTYSSITPVSADRIPEAQRIPGESEYYLAHWTIRVDHQGNQPYRLDLADTINEEYGGFILEATDSSGRKLEKNVFEGWSASSSDQYFHVTTAYPASKLDTSYGRSKTCGMTHNVTYATVRNNATVTLTPLDRVDAATSASGSASTQYRYYYHRKCPTFGVPGSFDFDKTGDRDYLTALNRLRDGEDVVIGYDLSTSNVFSSWTREGNERLLESYGKKPVTFVITDTGAQMLREPTIKAGRDFDFTSLNISKPAIGKPYSFGLNPDGSFLNEFVTDAGIGSQDDSNSANIPVISVEAKVGANWQKVADVDWTSGSCEVTYADGAASTDCKNVALPSGTTQWRTTAESRNVALSYSVNPLITLHATDAMREIAAKSFEDSFNPVRYVQNDANMQVFVDGKRVYAEQDNDVDRLWGYKAESEVDVAKSARQTGVNYNEGYVTIRYDADVSEKWRVPDAYARSSSESKLWKELVDIGEIEPVTTGVWYDLLPKGVYPDTSSLTLTCVPNLDGYSSCAGGGSIASVQTVTDWQGTGRVMMIVNVNFPQSPKTWKNPANKYSYYAQAQRLSFNARYDFDSIKDYGRQTHNVIAFEAEKNTFGTIEGYRGENDATQGGNHVGTARAFKDDVEREALDDVNPEHDKPVFVYAGVSQTVSALSAASTGLSKKVMANNNGVWGAGTYGDDIDVFSGGTYSYRLRIESDNATISKDLIFYDSFENFYAGASNDEVDIDAPRWNGTFKSIDVSQLESMGVKPVVYYSTVPNLRLDDPSNPKLPNAQNVDLSNSAVWSKTPPSDLSKVTAIAIDARKKADGSGFELQPKQAISAVVRMAAPSGEEAAGFIAADAHAYNNAFMVATSIDAKTGIGDEKAFVRNDYTKVGIKDFSLNVTKKWDDDSDRDGLRPDSLTVHLLANGVDTGQSLVLNEGNSWQGSFAHLAYADDEGNPIAYSFVEDEVAGYTARSSVGDMQALLVNRHDPERISVQGTKTWVNAEGATLPESIEVALLADGKQVATKTVKPDDSGKWNYEFTNLYKYRDGGTEIVYTVAENNAGEGWLSTAEGMNLTNTWHPYGDVVLSKKVENGTSVTAGLDFSFRVTLLDENENVLTGGYAFETSDGRTGTVKHGDTLTLKDGQSVRIKELPMGAVVRTEEADMPGFTAQGGTVKSATVKANEDAQIAYTNTYSAVGRINLEASKSLTGQPLRNGQFVFEVYDADGKLLRAASNNGEGQVTFGALSYTQADAGKTYTYTIKEKNAGAGGITYDGREYQARVTVTDNGDGTMSPTVEYVGLDAGQKPQFANAYHATGEAVLKAWKELDGRELRAGEFSFDLLDANNNVVQTKTNAADGTISFDPLQFDETQVGQRPLYVIRERAGTDSTVVYDTESVFGYQLEVVDQRDGTLGFNLTKVGVKQQGGVWVSTGETDDVAVFENSLQPGGLSVEKHTTDGTSDQDFRFKVKLTGKDVPENGTYNYDLSAVEFLPVNSIIIDALEVSNGEIYVIDGYNGTGYAGAWDDYYAKNGNVPKVTDVFPEYNDNYRMESGTLTSPSGKVYTCSNLDHEGREYNDVVCHDDSFESGFETFGFDGVHFYTYGSGESGLWTWDFKVTDGEKVGYGNVSYRSYAYDDCTYDRSSDKWTCNGANSAGTASATTGDLKVVLASSTSSRGSDTLLSSLRGGNSVADEAINTDKTASFAKRAIREGLIAAPASQARNDGKANTVIARSEERATKQSLFASLFNLGGINVKTADGSSIVSTFEVSGGTVTYYDDGTVELSDGLVISRDWWNDIFYWTSRDHYDYCNDTSECINRDEITAIKGKNIVLPADSSYLFGGFSSGYHNNSSGDGVVDFSALETWDTSNVTNMESMFLQSDLNDTSVLKNWNVSKVTDMSDMFRYTKIDEVSGLANWDTSNVTDMRGMFEYADLSNVDGLSAWDVSKVTNMSEMFQGCDSLSNIDGLSAWDVSKVTNMSRMFASYTGYQSGIYPNRSVPHTTNLDALANWDTSSLTNMAEMFSNNDVLEDISALANWDTSKVTNMSRLFYDNDKLANVDALANWDTSSLTNMEEMFYHCYSLSDISGLSNWDVSKVTKMSGLFSYNKKLVDLTPLATWNVSAAKDRCPYGVDTTLNDVGVTDFSVIHDSWQCDTYYSSDTVEHYKGDGWLYKPWHTFSTVKIHGTDMGIDVYGSDDPYGDGVYRGVWRNVDTGKYATDGVDGIWTGEPEYNGAGYDPPFIYLTGEGTWQRMVRFSFNPGEVAAGSKPAVEVHAGSDYQLPSANTFSNPHYTLTGWELRPKGWEDLDEYDRERSLLGTYKPGEIIPASEMAKLYPYDFELVAQWTPRDTSFEITDGEFEFTLRGGEKATFNNIPAGTAYEVYEMTEKGWVLVDSTGTSGVIKPTETSQASFTNRPVEGVTSVRVEATKLLDGVGAEAGEFNFRLTDGTNTQDVSNGAGGAIAFPQILVWDDSSMTEAQMLTRTPANVRENAFAIYPASALPKNLTISEVAGESAGIAYDNRSITATLNMGEGGNPVVTYNRAPVFENTTKPASLQVTKNVENAPANDASEFSVRVELVNENNVPLADTSAITGRVDGSLMSLDWADGATTVKLRGGQSLMLEGIPAGAGYTVSETDMPRGWAQTALTGGTGTLEAGQTATASVTNTYGASGEVNLEAYKSLVGRELEEDEFEFELLDPSGNVIATAKNTYPDIRTQIADDDGNWSPNPHKGHGWVGFEDIAITKAGTYTYTIREKNTGDTTVNYDNRTVTATVVATDNGNGTLSFDVSYSGGKDGANLFENEVVPLHMWLKKTIDNAEDVPAEYKDALFLYRVKLSGDTDLETRTHAITYSGVESSVGGEYRPATWTGSEMVIGVRAGEEVQLAYFPTGTRYEVQEIGWVLGSERHELGDTFSYVSGEHMSGAIEGDKATRTAHATNHYTEPETPPDTPPTPQGKTAKATIKAHKVAENYRLQGDDFTFELVDFDGNVIDSATNTASGEVVFGEITLTEADLDKVHSYYIRETVENPSGAWKYDTNRYKVEIVTDKNDEGELVASVIYEDGSEPTFTNTYKPTGYLALRADKEVTGEGAELAEGDFEFELRDSIGHTLATVTNEADGAVFFPTITYGAADVGKTYTYQIAEKIPVQVQGGWTYDEHVETVTVTVTDTGAALLDVNVTYDVGADFTADPATASSDTDTTFGALFVNSYEFNPPATGLMMSDDARGALLLVLLAALSGTAWTAVHLKRRRQA